MPDVAVATDTYISFLLNVAHLSPISVLSSFFLTLARILPSMILAPFFGARILPATIKVMFSICICAILLPSVLLASKQEIPFNLWFIGLAIKELFVGFILGFLIAIPFYIAQSAGSLIDHIRGSSSLQVTDPTTNTQTGPVGVFYNYVLIVVFFAIGGPFLYIEAFAKSFNLIPITEVLNPAFFSINIAFWKKMVGILHYIFSIAIQLGAPSIIGVLMAEMFLGIANRLAPQVQIVFLGISLKSWIVSMIVCLVESLFINLQ